MVEYTIKKSVNAQDIMNEDPCVGELITVLKFLMDEGYTTHGIVSLSTINKGISQNPSWGRWLVDHDFLNVINTDLTWRDLKNQLDKIPEHSLGDKAEIYIEGHDEVDLDETIRLKHAKAVNKNHSWHLDLEIS